MIKQESVNSLLSDLEKWKRLLQGSITQPEVVFDNSVRIASAKTQALESGTLKDRVARTDEEAETIARAEALRRQEPTIESASLTEEELEQIDEDVVTRLVDDLIYKTILKGE